MSIFRTVLPAPGEATGGVVLVVIATLVAGFGSWKVLNPIRLPFASAPTTRPDSKSSTTGGAAAADDGANAPPTLPRMIDASSSSTGSGCLTSFIESPECSCWAFRRTRRWRQTLGATPEPVVPPAPTPNDTEMTNGLGALPVD